MNPIIPLKYLEAYGPAVEAKVRDLIAQDRLGDYLRGRYPERHDVRNDKALRLMAMALKDRFLRSTAPLDKVLYDGKLQVLSQALGTHTKLSRVQGRRLKASREIRVATVFRDAPAPFLKMILVHELAHLKESDHNKAFYQLCVHMEPAYHQLEFDLRLYLTHLELQPVTLEAVSTHAPEPE